MLNHRSFTSVGGRFIVPLLAFSLLFSTAAPVFAQDSQTTTPIKHVVVIFQENISFDHYFATYPYAKNLAGEPKFFALPGTPSVNGLNSYLLNHNPNASNPFRISPAQAGQCDQDHNYRDEQRAFNNGLMDKFVEFTGNPGPDRWQTELQCEPGDGLRRREFGHGSLELCAVLCHERQQLWHDLRAVNAGRTQSRLRPDPRVRPRPEKSRR